MVDEDKLLSSNYDGIQEYDNDLPRWWLYLFYITIIFAPLYVWYFHYGPGLSPHENLAVQMKDLEAVRAKAAGSSGTSQDSEASLLALVNDKAMLNKGSEIFGQKCAVCHSAQGQGLIGPNLTDNFFIHGASIVDSKRTIENGVLDKGMLAWKGVLKPEEINAVVAFVYSLRGTNPPNAKPPQGNPAS